MNPSDFSIERPLLHRTLLHSKTGNPFRPEKRADPLRRSAVFVITGSIENRLGVKKDG
jgi:hypothetical protein